MTAQIKEAATRSEQKVPHLAHRPRKSEDGSLSLIALCGYRGTRVGWGLEGKDYCLVCEELYSGSKL